MDESIHEILDVLGDGGTTDMARRVQMWLVGGGSLGVRPDHIVGRAEIAEMVGRTRQQAAKLIKTSGFPEPFRTLDGDIELYDRGHIQRWIDGNPDLLGTDA